MVIAKGPRCDDGRAKGLDGPPKRIRLPECGQDSDGDETRQQLEALGYREEEFEKSLRGRNKAPLREAQEPVR